VRKIVALLVPSYLFWHLPSAWWRHQDAYTDDGNRLGGVYSAGYFRMSTWIPLSWGIINAVVLILASFAIQGGL